MELLNLVGELTWGNIPASLRDFVFIVILIFGLGINAYILHNLPKTDSQNVGSTLVLSNETGLPKLYTSKEVADKNKKILNQLTVIALTLILLALLRFTGYSVFKKEDTNQVRNLDTISMSDGQKIIKKGTIFTCIKTISGPVFVFETRRGQQSTNSDTMAEIISNNKVVTPTWWGNIVTYHTVQKLHLCRE